MGERPWRAGVNNNFLLLEQLIKQLQDGQPTVLTPAQIQQSIATQVATYLSEHPPSPGPAGVQGPAGPAGSQGTSGQNAIYQNGSSAQTTAKIWTASGTTGASGEVTFTPPAGLFSAVHVAVPVIERTSASDPHTTALVKTRTTTSIVVRVGESKTTLVSILGLSIDGLKASAAGVGVSLLAIGV